MFGNYFIAISFIGLCHAVNIPIIAMLHNLKVKTQPCTVSSGFHFGLLKHVLSFRALLFLGSQSLLQCNTLTPSRMGTDRQLCSGASLTSNTKLSKQVNLAASLIRNLWSIVSWVLEI